MITPETREYRSFEYEAQDEMILTGTPVVFNSPDVMYEIDGIKYYEQIDRGALDEADLSDVVLNVDHSGKPAARTRNSTLRFEIMPDGLHMRADLTKSSVGPDLHKDVKNGVYDRMSFAFTVKEEKYDTKLRMRTITKIARVFDVSCVTFPFYNQTTVSARSFFEAEAKKEIAEAIAAEEKRKRIELIGGSF